MPKRTCSRSLARNSTSADAVKRHRCQHAQQRGRRLARDSQAHSLARNAQPATATLQRKKGDYTSIVLEYDSDTLLRQACLGELDHACACDAIRFAGEPPSICCANGQVQLHSFLLLNTSDNCMMATTLTPSTFWKIFASTTVCSR